MDRDHYYLRNIHQRSIRGGMQFSSKHGWLVLISGRVKEEDNSVLITGPGEILSGINCYEIISKSRTTLVALMSRQPMQKELSASTTKKAALSLKDRQSD